MLVLLALASCHSGDPPPLDARPEHVVVLVVDGVRMEESLGDGTSQASGEPTEDFWPSVRKELLPLGTLVKPGWNTGITITAPAHCNLATGARVPYGNFVASEGLGYYLPELPTLFEAVRTTTGKAGHIVTNTDLVTAMAYSTYPGLGAAVGGEIHLITEDGSERPSIDDEPVSDAVIEVLKDEAPPLLIANLHSVDRAGHEGEDGEYTDRAHEVDELLVDVWNAIQKDKTLRDKTLLVVTADHGRHTLSGEDDEWRNHGDSCQGCRALPMFWVGPGVAAGKVVTTPWTLEDVGATIAAMLGVPLPYTEGRVMDDVVASVPAASPVGEDDIAAAGDHVFTRRWSSTGQVRSELLIDGEVLSTPGVFAAEAPRVAARDGITYACWRELHLDPAAPSVPWKARCVRDDGGGWQDIGYVYDEVPPFWNPALWVDEAGALWITSSTSTSGAVSDANEDGDVKVFSWSPEAGWVVPPGGVTMVSFVSSTALTGSGDTTWVAFGTSDQGNEEGRFTRHVEVREVITAGTEQAWTTVYTGGFGTDEAGAAWDRREWPALALTDGEMRLAMVGYGAEGTTVLTSSATVGTWEWSPLTRVDPTGRVLAHVQPRYAGDALYWARLDAAGLVEVCRLGPDDAAATCAPTGAATIRGLWPVEDGAYVSLGGDGWATDFVAF